MKIVEIRYDGMEDLSQTVGPFFDEALAEKYKEDLVARIVSAGWSVLPASTDEESKPGDGSFTRLYHQTWKVKAALRVRRFEEPLPIDRMADQIRQTLLFIPKF